MSIAVSKRKYFTIFLVRKETNHMVSRRRNDIFDNICNVAVDYI